MLQVLTYAFLVVVSNVAIMVPVLLYAFNLQELGWKWQHAALFTSMVASTDAVAVSAILQSGAYPPAPACCSLASGRDPDRSRHSTSRYYP